jgi:hypothetical protein
MTHSLLTQKFQVRSVLLNDKRYRINACKLGDHALELLRSRSSQLRLHGREFKDHLFKGAPRHLWVGLSMQVKHKEGNKQRSPKTELAPCTFGVAF